MSNVPFAPTANQPDHSQRFAFARAALVILWIVVVLLSLAALPGSFATTQADWLVNEAAGPLSSLLAYETLVAIVTVIKLVLLGLFLATAALLLAQPPQTITLLAAFTLMALPFSIELVGQTGFSGVLGEATAAMASVLGIVGIFSLVLLLFVFPDGRFIPRWLVVILGLAVLVVVVLLILPDAGDIAWMILMATLGILLLSALSSQLWRYRHAGPVQRRQTIWFLIATFAFVAWILTSALWISPVFNLVLGYLPMFLLPVALVAAVWRGTWGPEPAKAQRLGFMAVIGLLALTSFAGTAAWWQQSQTEPIDVNALVTGDPTPFLLDADMAMDDITALFYLLQHPGADLKAITVNGVAFAHCDGGVHNALGLLELANAPEIPVACGRDTAYPGGTPAPDSWRKNADELYGAAVRTGGRMEDPRPAAELFADTIRAAPGEIVVLAIGPLTNLAEAFEADPELPGLIRSVVIMGGAVDVGGNVANEEEGIDNQFAEWNIFADPVAADIVFKSGVPLMLVPLDATNDVPFTRAFHQKLSSQHLTKPATFTYNLFYLNPFWLDGGLYWWDTLAVAAGLDPSLVTLEDATLEIVTQLGPEMGRTMRTLEGAPVKLATQADARRFEGLLLALLNH